MDFQTTRLKDAELLSELFFCFCRNAGGLTVIWTLILYFTTCGPGCAKPLALPAIYTTEQQCTEAGNRYLNNPTDNPARTVASFECHQVKGPKEVYRFRPEQE